MATCRILVAAIHFTLFAILATASSSAQQPAQFQLQQPATVTVHVTKTGMKYHQAGCRYPAKSSIPIGLDEAARRYDPCSVCRPPVPQRKAASLDGQVQAATCGCCSHVER